MAVCVLAADRSAVLVRSATQHRRLPTYSPLLSHPCATVPYPREVYAQKWHAHDTAAAADATAAAASQAFAAVNTVAADAHAV